MAKRNMSEPIFHNATAAREYLEGIRWPNGPVCPHCGTVGKAYKLPKTDKVRDGLYKCASCHKQFSVTVGTLFERSHIPLDKWLTGFHLLAASKKGISSHQLGRMLGLTYKSAWFMAHRIREAMKDPHYVSQLGGPGKVVEADETFWGNKGRNFKGARGWGHKEKIFSLVERGGKVRSFHVPTVSSGTLRPIMKRQIAEETAIVTDDARYYGFAGRMFGVHFVVNHSEKEYVRGPIHTNTIENYFSILKRGLTGVYQHVSAQHLRRYVGEFDFRYNSRELTDAERVCLALAGIGGKRLVYRDSSRQSG